MMMKTVILICALGVARPDCTTETATTLIQGPDTNGLASCGFVGQAFLADTAFADYLNGDHYLKILCMAGDRLEARSTSKPDPQDLAQTTEAPEQ